MEVSGNNNTQSAHLVWSHSGFSTHMYEKDRGHAQFGPQSQSIACRNGPGSVHTRVLTQTHSE